MSAYWRTPVMSALRPESVPPPMPLPMMWRISPPFSAQSSEVPVPMLTTTARSFRLSARPPTPTEGNSSTLPERTP